MREEELFCAEETCECAEVSHCMHRAQMPNRATDFSLYIKELELERDQYRVLAANYLRQIEAQDNVIAALNRLLEVRKYND